MAMEEEEKKRKTMTSEGGNYNSRSGDGRLFPPPELPHDWVAAEILTRLPAKSLMRFKCEYEYECEEGGEYEYEYEWSKHSLRIPYAFADHGCCLLGNLPPGLMLLTGPSTPIEQLENQDQRQQPEEEEQVNNSESPRKATPPIYSLDLVRYEFDEFVIGGHAFSSTSLVGKDTSKLRIYSYKEDIRPLTSLEFVLLEAFYSVCCGRPCMCLFYYVPLLQVMDFMMYVCNIGYLLDDGFVNKSSYNFSSRELFLLINKSGIENFLCLLSASPEQPSPAQDIGCDVHGFVKPFSLFGNCGH